MSTAARRALNAAQLTLGLLTLARPRAVVTTLTPNGTAVPDPRIVRLLGARQIVQGAIGLARPSDTITSLGAVVDATHAVSLVPIIVFSRRYRASASVSAGLAATAAVAGLLVP